MACMTDKGYKAGEKIRTDAVKNAALIRQAAALLIAVDNASQIIDSYNEQHKIAKRSVSIAEKQQWRLQNVFWPRELSFLDEFATNPAPDLKTENLKEYYAGMLQATVLAKYGPEFGKLRCGKGRYHKSQYQKNTSDLGMAMTSSFSNARHMGFDLARSETYARSDRTYQRRFQAITMGRGLMQAAAGLMGAGAENLNKAATAYSSRFNDALSALGSAWGRTNAAKTAGDEAVWKKAFDLSQEAPRNANLAGQSSPSDMFSLKGYLDAGAAQFNSQSSVEHSMLGVGGQTGNQGFGIGDSLAGPSNVNYMAQSQQINNGYVGNRDRVRSGIMEFPVIGGSGVVFVDMNQFPLIFADDEQVLP